MSRSRKRKFSDEHPATLQVAERQKLLLDEQLKVVKLQQEGERERTAEQLKLLKLQQEGQTLRNLILKEQLKKAQEGALHLESII